MYVYKLERSYFDTPTGAFKDKGEITVCDPTYYSSKDKALKVLDKRIERMKDRDFRIISITGSENMRTNTVFNVVLIDSEQVLEEYGYNTVVQYTTTKIEVK